MSDAPLVPPDVHVVWWVGLIVTLLVFVPLAVSLLHRTWRAARTIERYAAEALVAATGIVENTRHVAALDATVEVAGELLGAAGDVAGKLDTVAGVLAERAG